MMKRGCRDGELKAGGGWSGKMNGTADKEENEAFFHIFRTSAVGAGAGRIAGRMKAFHRRKSAEHGKDGPFGFFTAAAYGCLLPGKTYPALARRGVP